MLYFNHLVALFVGVALGFLLCCLFASRTRSRDLREIDDEELLARLTGDENMPRIPEKLIKEIEDKTNIVDVVSEHVYLKPHGRNYVGICPFHTEGLETSKRIKMASCLILPLAEQTAGRTAAETRRRKMPREHQEDRAFSVNPELQIYKCFSCGAGGPVFKFVQDIADISFIDAVYALAQRCDVEMPERQKGAQ